MNDTQRKAIDAIKGLIWLARAGKQPDAQTRAELTSQVGGWCPQSVDAAFEEVDG